jgi:peptide/nickel transport system substrate-binding protein
MRKHLRKAVVAVTVVALATAVAATIGSASSSKNGAAKKGGTYRVGWEAAFGFSDNFDPTGEYIGNAWGIYSNLLIRTLVGYTHQPGGAGNKTVPDLATSVPKPTNGGKTYTYHIRQGVKFGPPVSRQVTSADVKFAMQRLANKNDGGEYGFYYTIIKGWDAYNKGTAKSVSGISTPNKSTIVFHLTRPAGDFNLRMSMPATGPIPVEVGKCFTGAKAGNYGRDLISSGPYMVKGEDGINKSSCATIKPTAGYDGADGTHIILVRNPNYVQSTDKYRRNLPDEFDFTIDSNADDIFAKVQAGDLEDEISQPPPKTIRAYVTNASLSKHLFKNVGDRTNYITMNLTQAPFDDIHVRKAMNLIIDKASLQKAWGGTVAGSIATHVTPDPMLNNVLKGYDPYKTPGSAGSVALAEKAMKGSKYSTKGDGKCDAAACKNVLLVSDERAVDGRMLPIIQADAAKIGITFKVRSVNGAYPVIQTPKNNIPISDRSSWGKDYADPGTFFTELFLSNTILPSGNGNYSLVGLTPAIAKAVHASGNVNGVPSADSLILRCDTLSGDVRTACWASADRLIMTKVVPWVPYFSTNNVFITGPKVTHWQYDQFSDGTAYSQVSVG